jgi:hypothetical protein
MWMCSVVCCLRIGCNKARWPCTARLSCQPGSFLFSHCVVCLHFCVGAGGHLAPEGYTTCNAGSMHCNGWCGCFHVWWAEMPRFLLLDGLYGG